MDIEIPQTVVECAGCNKELNVLVPHLSVQLKAQNDVLLTEDIPADDPASVPTQRLFLGTRSGRGAIRKFHDFACLGKYADGKKKNEIKLEYHYEEGDMYVPEDNRGIEQLVKDGDLPKEALAFHKALEGDGEAVVTRARS